MQVDVIYNEDCRQGLKKLPDASVDCIVTSPPYYGLRDYGTGKWTGGDPACNHKPAATKEKRGLASSTLDGGKEHSSHQLEGYKNTCARCGAVREDKQIGLEKTPEAYIQIMVEIFMECYRILKPHGTFFLNLGDSYWGGKGQSGSQSPDAGWERETLGKSFNRKHQYMGGGGVIRPTDTVHKTIKPKDLVGIPWAVAIALRDAGWYLRQDIIWQKPSCMPESVVDRCTKSHEYIFMFTKNGRKSILWRARDTREWAWEKPDLSEMNSGNDGKERPRWVSYDYYFDADAIATPIKDSSVLRYMQDIENQKGSERVPGKTNGNMKAAAPAQGGLFPGRNPRKGIDQRGGNQGAGEGIPYIGMAIHGSTFKEGHSGYFTKDGELIGKPTANKRSVWEADDAAVWKWMFQNAPKRTVNRLYAEYWRQAGYEPDVWKIQTEQFKEAHFAVFPQELASECIKAGCPAGGVVLDPFSGSGTSALVAKKLGCSYVGFELNHEYTKIKDRRFELEFGLFNQKA